MNRKIKISINIFSNILIHAVHLSVSFALMPKVLQYFGKDVFGIHSYVTSIVIVFTFASSATSMSLMKFIPELVHYNNEKEFNCYWSTMAMFSGLITIPAGIALIYFPNYGSYFMNIDNNFLNMTKDLFKILGVFVILQFMKPVISGILYGLELFAYSNIIQLVNVFFTVTAYVLTIKTNSSLLQYITIIQIGQIVTMLSMGILLFIKCPFRIKLQQPKLHVLKKLLSLNTFFIVNQAAHNLIHTTDKIILQKIFGAASVAEYHVARQIDILLQSFISLPLSAIMPSITKAYVSKEFLFIKKMNSGGTLLYCVLMAPPLTILFCLLEDFIYLWVGEGFENAILAGRLFIVAILASTPIKVFSHILVAIGKVKALGYAKVAYALINIPLSIFLTYELGIIGVVIPTVGYWIFFHPILISFLAFKHGSVGPILINYALVLSLLPFTYIMNQFVFHESSSSWFSFIKNGINFYLYIIASYIIVIFAFKPLRKDMLIFIDFFRNTPVKKTTNEI